MGKRQKWLTRSSKLRVLLGVLLVFASPLDAEQKITADWVETQLAKSGHIRTYVGQVAWVDSAQNLTIRADSAVVKDGQYLFLSGLSFTDSVRRVQANKLSYDTTKDIATFLGKVTLQDGTRSLRADFVEVWPNSGRVRARGDVKVELPELGQTIEAENLYLPDTSGVGGASGNVVASSVSGDETVRISTDSLTFSQDTVHLGFLGQTIIKQAGWSLVAQKGIYTKEWLQTEGTPEMTWSDSGRADSVWAVSEHIIGYFNDQAMEQLLLKKNARITWQSEQDSLGQTRTLWGDSMVVNMHDQAISSVLVFRKPRLKLRKESTDISISGDTLFVWFTDRSIDSLVVRGNSNGTYVTPGQGTANISGRHKTLWFRQDALYKMTVVEQARCQYMDESGRESNDARVTGQALTMSFVDGVLTEIEAMGKIRGAYLHSELDKTK